MNIVLIGSGNVAYHLGKTLNDKGHQILQVYSRAFDHASNLASKLNSKPVCHIDNLVSDADLYIIAITDQAIPDTSALLPKITKGIVVHTSGATDVNVLTMFANHGVIYPPQSLTKEVRTDLSEIPFAIEGNTKENEEVLLKLVQSFAPKSFICNSRQRLALHISAVFVNNFPNALFQIAEELLKEQHLSFELLKPIILETARKVQNNTPTSVQTGPAIRNDQLTLKKHLNYLNKHEDWQDIYQLLSSFIGKNQI